MSPRKPSSVSSESRVIHYVTRGIVVLVAVGAAVLSFDALTALAAASGVPSQLSWVWAVVVDGFILVSTLAAFALRDRSGRAKYYAWTTLGVFVIISILGNAWHAVIVKQFFELPIWVAVIVTAIPPLALFLAIHLLIIMVSPTPEQKLEYKRQLEHQNRLDRLKEKEIEKLERAAILREVKEQATISIPEPVYSEGKEIPVVKEKPVLNSGTGTTVPSQEGLMSVSEVTRLLDEKLSMGEALPSGKQISDWLGKAERTGQKFLKSYKETKGLI